MMFTIIVNLINVFNMMMMMMVVVMKIMVVEMMMMMTMLMMMLISGSILQAQPRPVTTLKLFSSHIQGKFSLLM